MSKKAIIERFESWINAEDFQPSKDVYEEIQNEFKRLADDYRKQQLAAFTEAGGEESEFSIVESEEDLKFKEINRLYHEKRKAKDKARKDSIETNTKAKLDLIAELQELIQDEENIGKAYQRFNAIKQKWNEIGEVRSEQRREVQAEYSRLIELFYYNINIYRELQINDLKKNQELKLELIEKIKSLEEESSVNQVDFLIHQYLDEWDQIGPTFREEWEKIRDDFRSAVNAVFERIRAHRKEVKSTHDEHFKQKQALVERVKELGEQPLEDVKEVQRITKAIIDTQKEWKQIGYAGRSKNDQVWKDFRAVCDAYFDKRKKFLAKNSEKLSQHREVKKGIIDRAKEIYQGDDVSSIANELKKLQRDWKNAGKLLPQEEYRLFKEFRGYCDAFFDRKKNEAKAAEKELKENLKQKEELIVNFTQQLEKEVKEKGEAIIEEWSEAWSQVGDVGERMHDKVEQSFSKLVNRAYKELGISQKEVVEKQFKNKLERLTNDDQAEQRLQSERRFLQAKIKEAKSNAIQLEDKLGFFKHSDDSNPLKKELLDRIEVAQNEVDAWLEKRKKVDMAIKEVRRAEQVEEVEEDISSAEKAE